MRKSNKNDSEFSDKFDRIYYDLRAVQITHTHRFCLKSICHRPKNEAIGSQNQQTLTRRKARKVRYDLIHMQYLPIYLWCDASLERKIYFL